MRPPVLRTMRLYACIIRKPFTVIRDTVIATKSLQLKLNIQQNIVYICVSCDVTLVNILRLLFFLFTSDERMARNWRHFGNYAANAYLRDTAINFFSNILSHAFLHSLVFESLQSDNKTIIFTVNTVNL